MDLLADHRVKDDWLYMHELDAWVAPECWDVITQIRDELANPQWITWQHGSRTTYKKGCHGPLCKKAYRDYGREYQRKHHGHTRVRVSPHQKFDPIIQGYKNLYERWRRENECRRAGKSTTSLLEVGTST